MFVLMVVAMKSWVFITGEYPPARGGVADYTRSVAHALAQAGDSVHIFAPINCAGPSVDSGIQVHLLPGHFGLCALRMMSRELRKISEPYTIFVQYVPHAYGWKAMNLPFCLWLFGQRRRDVWIMVHEVCVAMGWRQPLKHNILGAVHRVMGWFALRGVRRAFLSIPAWTTLIAPLAPKNLPRTWLPVPSNVVATASPEVARGLRDKFLGGAFQYLVGHFGTYGSAISTTLSRILPPLLEQEPHCAVVLVGRSSKSFAEQFLAQNPSYLGRIIATGDLPADEIASHLAACDLMLQPFPDGVSSRRTSMMAGLALALPIVTNEGCYSESIWRETGAVALASVDDPHDFVNTIRALLADVNARNELASRGNRLYNAKFTLQHTIETLQQAAGQHSNC
jgi:hypothetical protein